MRIGSSLKGVVACGVTVVLGLAPVQAAAAIVHYVFEGYVTYGDDSTGVFGGPGILDGRPVVIRTTFDTSVGRITIPFFEDAIGGEGSDSPLVRASFTVGGETFVVPASTPDAPIYSNTQLFEPSPSLTQIIHLSSGGIDGALALHLDLHLDSALLPTSLDTPFDLSAAAPGGPFGGELFVGRFSPDYQSDLGAGGQFALTRAYTVLPEPATWAIMILGFGLAGGALRRRGPAGLALN